jgi:hypothetical protein
MAAEKGQQARTRLLPGGSDNTASGYRSSVFEYGKRPVMTKR